MKIKDEDGGIVRTVNITPEDSMDAYLVGKLSSKLKVSATAGTLEICVLVSDLIKLAAQ